MAAARVGERAVSLRLENLGTAHPNSTRNRGSIMGNGRRAWSEALEHAQESFRRNQAIFTTRLRDSRRKLAEIRKETRLLRRDADKS